MLLQTLNYARDRGLRAWQIKIFWFDVIGVPDNPNTHAYFGYNEPSLCIRASEHQSISS